MTDPASGTGLHWAHGRIYRSWQIALAFICGAALTAFGLMLALPAPVRAQITAQADRGADAFFLNCSTCHGRHGEGLTDEARSQMFPPEDVNCWQSKCHAPNHPPDGFVFPRYVPALIGFGTLGSFDTAQDLYDFIITKMPFQNPGWLPEAEYWDIVAFLLRAHGTTLTSEVNAGNAASFPMHADMLATPAAAKIVSSIDPPPDPVDLRWFTGALVFLALLAAGMLFQALWLLRRARPRV